jgi:hypothetical protein
MISTRRFQVSSRATAGAAYIRGGTTRNNVRESGTCPVCGAEFKPRRPWQKYCTERCRHKAKNQRRPVLRLPASLNGPQMPGNPHSGGLNEAILYHVGQIIRLIVLGGVKGGKR